jgi:hypothetical protein
LDTNNVCPVTACFVAGSTYVDVLAERDPFELRRNLRRVEAGWRNPQAVDDVEEERFGQRVGRNGRSAGQAAHVVRELEVHDEQLLESFILAPPVGHHYVRAMNRRHDARVTSA